MPWDFTAEQTDQTIRIGETSVATFKVTNHADHPITARAVFNVTPEQAGVYFRKLSCFCFSDQTVAAGATAEFPRPPSPAKPISGPIRPMCPELRPIFRAPAAGHLQSRGSRPSPATIRHAAPRGPGNRTHGRPSGS